MYTEKDKDRVRFTLEVLIVGYVSGVVMEAGAPLQRQFWFMPLVPILIEMVGLPSILTCWIYGYFYPINRRVNVIREVPESDP